MSTMTFGTKDGKQEFFERYGVSSYQELGEKMQDAQYHKAIQDAERVEDERVAVYKAKPSYTATDRAINYMIDLAMEKPETLKAGTTRQQLWDWAKSVESHVVSEKIDELKGSAKQDFTPVKRESKSLERHGVPAGRYAITATEGHTTFLRVEIPKEGKWAGRIFVQVQAGDELHRTNRDMADTLLARIAAAGVKEASFRYGHELGKCGVCGRTLTDETSRERGIGPVCADKMGW